MWLTVKSYVRQIQSDDGVIIVDDSIAWHYDHTKGYSAKGINSIAALYHVGDISLPVNYRLVEKTEFYTDKKTGKEKRKSPITKNDHHRQVKQILFHYVLNDIWFALVDNMKFIKHELERAFVVPLKTIHFALKANLYVNAL